jgi:cobalt-zinc-cadmium efflux system protein
MLTYFDAPVSAQNEPMHTHNHNQKHGHHHGSHHSLRGALFLTLGYAAIEVVAGLWSGSLTLLGDAGHMLTDSVSLGLAAAAAWLARRPPSALHSYGLGRAEVVAALVNALFMLGVITAIAVEAFQRLQEPQPVAGLTVMSVAGVGLLINVGVALILVRGESTLNVRAALLHVFGDLLGSVAALAAGAVIYQTGWYPIDPILALVVCGLLLYSTVNLLRESLHIVMEGVPLHLDLPAVGRDMAEVPGIASVHDLHIWTLTSGTIALSAHIVVDELEHWDEILSRLNALLNERYGIEHTTLQPETGTHPLWPMPFEAPDEPHDH